MTAPTPPQQRSEGSLTALDTAWKNLEADALASDGRITDADVKTAIKRGRAAIEQAAAEAAREEVFARIEAGVLDDVNRAALTKVYEAGREAARAEVERLREALIWCSGSPSFAPEGEAREGWVKLCQPLLTHEGQE